jgi:hypothetical protein
VAANESITIDSSGAAATGHIVFDGNAGNRLSLDRSVVLTIGSHIVVAGQAGTIGTAVFQGAAGTLTNHGTIQADTGAGTITLAAATSSDGTLQALNGSTLALAADVTGTGTITTDSGNGSTVAQNGAKISGATITGALVPNASAANQLGGASIGSGGALNLSTASERVTGGLTLDGVIHVSAGSTLGFGVAAGENLTVDSSGSGKIGSIVLDSNTANAISLDNGVTLALGSGIVLSGQGGTVGPALFHASTGSLVNAGTISTTGNGTVTLSPATLTNNGTIQVGTGSTVGVTSPFTNFDASTSTLTGGTYIVAGTLQFPGAHIVTNAATIALDGVQSAILDSGTSGNALADFATNTATGSFTVRNGRGLTVSGDFTNAGALAADATGGPSAFRATGSYTQTGGTTTLTHSATLSSGTSTVDIQAGTLAGDGAIVGNLTNAGTVSPGTASTAGRIVVNGTYTQAAGGTLSLKLAGTGSAGTDYDELSVTGAATLNGTIALSALGGFAPSSGDSFHVLNFASSSGDFSTQTGFAFGNVFLVEDSAANSLSLDATTNELLVTNGTDDHVDNELSLREAVAAANTGSRAGVDVSIRFDASLSGDTINLSHGKLELGAGGPAGSGAITIDASALAQPITISGQGSTRVFQVDTGVSADLNGLIITQGSSSGTGGGIFNGGRLNLINSTVSTNTAVSGGGGIENQGTLIVSGGSFQGNHSGFGGAIDSNGGAAVLQLTGGSFQGNFGVNGGAIAVHNRGGAAINGATFSSNQATMAGGALWSDGALTVTGTTFASNKVTTGNGDGGGAIAIEGGDPTITGNDFANNAVTAAATGIANAAGGAIVSLASGGTIKFNRFSGNTDAIAANGDTVALVTPASPNLDDNWWASNTGPNDPDVVSGEGGTFTPVAVNSFLLLSIASSPNPVEPNHAATVTASFTTDSAGNAISGTSLGVLANRTADFTGNTLAGSTLTGTPTTVQNGQAAATYQAGPNGGDDQVSATVDGVTVSTAINVREAAAITSDNATTFTVGTNGTFTVTATGFPTPSLSITNGTLPADVQFTDNQDGTATISGIPAAGTGNTYTVTITAHNGIGADATQTFTLTVNEAPTITSANAKTFTVGTADTFTISTGHDFPAATSLGETGDLPNGLTFHDNGDGTATISGTPAAGTGKSYALTITAHNGVNPDAQQSFTLTVNEPASVSSAATATFIAGQSNTFTVTTVGFPTATLTPAGTLPGGVNFHDNGDGTATISGIPDPSIGVYVLSLTATNGSGSTTQTFALNVVDPSTISSADNATFTVGQPSVFPITVNRGLPRKTTISESGALPTGVKFVAGRNGNGAKLRGTPAPGTGGVYHITLTAKNGSNVTPQSFTLTVNEAASFTTATSTSIGVGQNLTFNIKTHGYPAITLTQTGDLPQGVTFHDNGDGTATLSGMPADGTAKTYPLVITAHNGVGSDAVQNFSLTVNQPPAFTSADHTTFTTSQSGTFSITTSAGTPPGTDTVTEDGKLPTGVTFTGGANGTATLAGIPAPGTGGVYPITLTVGDGSASSTQQFTLTVNEPPSFTTGLSVTMAVGQSKPFEVKTTGFPYATLTATGALPAGVSFVDHGDGTGALTGTPAANSAGTYTLLLTAHNGSGSDATQNFTLTVNQPPAFTSADHMTFPIGSATTFTITTSAGAPSATTITRTGKLPTGVTFKDNGDGTATLSGTPAVGTGGAYHITLTAGNGVTNSTQAFTLTVGTTPKITTTNHTTYVVGVMGSFVVKSSGFPAAAFSVNGTLPAGVQLVDNHDGTATLAGAPAAGSTGTYTFHIIADNGSTTKASQQFTLTVKEAPVFTSAATTTFIAGALESFTITTTGTPTAKLTATGHLPTGVRFIAKNDGTAVLKGILGSATKGTYTLVITASNGSATPPAIQLFTLVVS